jgi:hypothetical protein
VGGGWLLMLGVEHWTCVDGCSVREPFNLLIS